MQVKIDDSDLRKVIRDLKTVKPLIVKEVRRRAKEAGERIKVAAEKEVSPHSKSIPPTIKVRATITKRGASVTVRAGSKEVPLAALYEYGNKGERKDDGDFRHPVFGNRNAWVKQERHPFLKRAALAEMTEVGTEIGKALEPVRKRLEGRSG
jgi:hypothetical protein